MKMSALLVLTLSAPVMACGGGISDRASEEAAGTPASPNPPQVDAPKTVGAGCPTPASVIVPSGGTIARPVGSALRLQLVYEGSSIGVQAVRGEDMVLPGGNDGPFADSSGYWVELRSASKPTFRRILRDPTVQEAPAAPGGLGFSISTIDRCVAKLIEADVPNDGAVDELVIFGSPYGTQERAAELARFSIE